MLKKWTIEHFKSVNERVELELAPLTLFAGANSSGKSTIIQSILLTAQTIQSQVTSRPIILNGHIVRLGTFNDILSTITSSKIITIGFTLAPDVGEMSIGVPSGRFIPRYTGSDLESAIKSIDCTFSFSGAGADAAEDIPQLQPRLESSKIVACGLLDENLIVETVEIRRAPEDAASRAISLKVDRARQRAGTVSALDYEVVGEVPNPYRAARYMASSTVGTVVGSVVQHFLPVRYVVVFDVVDVQARATIESITGTDRPSYVGSPQEDSKSWPVEFIEAVLRILEQATETASTPEGPSLGRQLTERNVSSLRSSFSVQQLKNIVRRLTPQSRRFLRERFEEHGAELRKMLTIGRSPEYSLAYATLPELADAATESVQAFFTGRVKYLGPLRDEPKPLYPLAGNLDPRDIGLRGENTAAVLELYRNRQIEYLPPREFSRLGEPFSIEQASLHVAVLEWLRYLGMAQDVRTFDQGKLGHELKVSMQGSNSLHDLTHVGVGLSQILPILVQSLLADTGSTLVFEQPELHLHPRVQTRLADFFLTMVFLHKQCIIETHSEYLINRLRYMAAVTEGEKVSKDVMVYFVEKVEGASVYREIRISKYGVIDDWPTGFFDENEQNAANILAAGMNKRHREKQDRKS